MARAGRRRRITAVAAGVIVACLLAAVPVTWSLLPKRAQTIAPASNYSIYVDGKKGWSLRYPSNWHIQPYDDTIDGRFHQRGILVSNADLTFSHPACGTGCSTSAWDMSGLPDGGVVVNFEFAAGGLKGPITGHPDTHFPLALEDLSPVRLIGEDQAPGVRARHKDIWVGGSASYTTWMYSRSPVTTAAMDAARRMIASITKPGTDVVTEHRYGWSLTYPSTWSLHSHAERQSTGSCCYSILSNKELGATCSRGCPPTLPHQPPNTVVLQLGEYFFGSIHKSETQFPLTGKDLRNAKLDSKNQRFTVRGLEIQVNKPMGRDASHVHTYFLTLYVGREASIKDIQRLKSVVFSLAPLKH
jgi:hypothetical protein